MVPELAGGRQEQRRRRSSPVGTRWPRAVLCVRCLPQPCWEGAQGAFRCELGLPVCLCELNWELYCLQLHLVSP